MDDFFDAFKPKPKYEHTTKVVHFRKEDYDIFIARPSKWGCPFTIINNRSTRAEYVVGSRKELFEKYEDWLENGDGKHLLNDLHELKKKCHGDVLVKLIEKYKP